MTFSFLSFAAGFSERWAQDMLVLGQRRLRPEPSTAPQFDEILLDVTPADDRVRDENRL